MKIIPILIDIDVEQASKIVPTTIGMNSICSLFELKIRIASLWSESVVTDIFDKDGNTFDVDNYKSILLHHLLVRTDFQPHLDFKVGVRKK